MFVPHLRDGGRPEKLEILLIKMMAITQSHLLTTKKIEKSYTPKWGKLRQDQRSKKKFSVKIG